MRRQARCVLLSRLSRLRNSNLAGRTEFEIASDRQAKCHSHRDCKGRGRRAAGGARRNRAEQAEAGQTLPAEHPGCRQFAAQGPRLGTAVGRHWLGSPECAVEGRGLPSTVKIKLSTTTTTTTTTTTNDHERPRHGPPAQRNAAADARPEETVRDHGAGPGPGPGPGPGTKDKP